jgi:hypothetical protein
MLHVTDCPAERGPSLTTSFPDRGRGGTGAKAATGTANSSAAARVMANCQLADETAAKEGSISATDTSARPKPIERE